MGLKRGTGLFIVSIILTALISSVIPVNSATATHVYDEGNRLIRTDYPDGSKIEYTYDESGNRTVKVSQTTDTVPPVSTASPLGGTYADAQSVALTCNDNAGSGCDKIYYTTDGTTPTTSSSVYTAPISITATTTLKYFSRDMAGNSEAVKSQSYSIAAVSIPGGGSTPVFYYTLQAAYDAANTGDTIRVRAVNMTESLNVNRNIQVNLEGGYNQDYSGITGTTTLKGMIQTMAGGGTLTIKNFILQN